MLATTLILFSILVGFAEPKPVHRAAGPANSVRQDSRVSKWPINTDLSKEGSVKNKLTLYRGMTSEAEITSTRERIGKSPIYMSSSGGDFNVAGTDVLYLWSDEDAAEIWCDIRVNVKKDKKCAISTYEWTPPANVRVKRWNKGDKEWYEYVKYNYEAPKGQPANIQKKNDWIEGPVSVLPGNKGDDYQPNGVDIQHALLNSRMLDHFSIKSVGDDITSSKDRPQNDRGGMEMPLGEMRMFTDFDAQMIRKV